MAFFPPIPLIRKRVIVKSLAACGATSESSAKSLSEAGVLNPDCFRRITDRLVRKGVIHRTPDGRYYL
ncbi:MAG: hypothetical protein IJS66_02175 [Bacteroidales bacterium]|nr:hypothetical protein [Bacteroidales bacterium]